VAAEETAVVCVTTRVVEFRSIATMCSIATARRSAFAAPQLFEKYLQLGRDATSSGDRVTAEGFFQHAEHYFRILNAMNQAAQQGQPNGQGQNQGGNRRNYQQGEGYQGNDEGQGGGSETDDSDQRAPGMGDQPEAREIPIAAAPPEG
jgi:hypothetical protein